MIHAVLRRYATWRLILLNLTLVMHVCILLLKGLINLIKQVE